jgi:5-methylcytosine-specific restriction endonuclease McrA
MTKICAKCKVEKDYNEFYYRSDRNGRPSSHCRSCSSSQARGWYANNKERSKAYHRMWVAKNPERQRKLNNDWKERYPGRHEELTRLWRENNRERYVAYVRENGRNRKARKRGASVERFSVSEWKSIMKFYWGLCAYCEKSPAKVQEHVLALIDGGTHSLSNLVPSCEKCNTKKEMQRRKGIRFWLPRRHHPALKVINYV